MPKIDIERLEPEPPGEIPPQFAAAAVGRVVRNLSTACGVTDFVTTHVIVPPGGWSAQRHWHEGEDEIVAVLSGEAVLVDDAGRHPMRVGDVAVFPKGYGNAHHLRNDGDAQVVLLAISLPEASTVHYPDIGMRLTPEGSVEHEN